MIPIALCKPVTSNLVGMKAIVASPGLPPAVKGGIKNRIIDSGFLSEYVGMVTTRERGKCLKPRIFLAADGSAKMVVRFDLGLSWRSVASWQWSGFSWDIRTTLGSGICERCSMHAGRTSLERRNLGW